MPSAFYLLPKPCMIILIPFLSNKSLNTEYSYDMNKLTERSFTELKILNIFFWLYTKDTFHQTKDPSLESVSFIPLGLIFVTAYVGKMLESVIFIPPFLTLFTTYVPEMMLSLRRRLSTLAIISCSVFKTSRVISLFSKARKMNLAVFFHVI